MDFTSDQLEAKKKTFDLIQKAIIFGESIQHVTDCCVKLKMCTLLELSPNM